MFVLMFGVLFCLCTPFLSVCIAISSGEVMSHPKTNLVKVPRISSLRQAMSLVTFLPNNVHVNHCDMLRLI
jgi:hypothetical protein